MFAAAFGPDSINKINAAKAMGEYEKTISVFDTPYDMYLAGDLTAM